MSRHNIMQDLNYINKIHMDLSIPEHMNIYIIISIYNIK